MSQVLNIMYIYLYTYVKNGNICYLLLILRCALVLLLGWRLSTERAVAQPLHLYPFPQVGTLLVAVVLFSIM